jgi:hypothetical protein
MANRNVKGGWLTVTVLTPIAVAPAVGDTYTNNGVTWTVEAVSLVGTGLGGSGLGTISFFDRAATTSSLLTTSAALTKATGAGSNINGFGGFSWVVSTNTTNLKQYIATNADTIVMTGLADQTLIIDGEDAADMARLTVANAPSAWSITRGVVEFRNASTTQVMNIQVAGSYGAMPSGGSAIVRYLGNYIQIATSDGTRGQTIDLNYADLNGNYYDNIAWIEAEHDPVGAPGEYVPLLNIGGSNVATAFYNKGGITQTTSHMSLAEFGQTVELGNYFEFDEYNGGAAYGRIYIGKADCFSFGCINGAAANVAVGAVYTHNGSTFTVVAAVNGAESAGARNRLLACVRTAGTNDPTTTGTLTYVSGSGDTSNLTFDHVRATGGWVPPDTAKIRMANINITSLGKKYPDARMQMGTGAYSLANVVFDTVNISDRITLSGAYWNFFNNASFTNFGACAPDVYTSGWNPGPVSYDGYFVAPWKYGSGVALTIGTGGEDLSLDRIYTVSGNQSSNSPLAIAENKKITSIGFMSVCQPRRIAGGTHNYAALTFNTCSGAESDRQAIVDRLRVVGGGVAVYRSDKLHINHVEHSDTASGVATKLYPSSIVNTTMFSEYISVKDLSLLPSGAPTYNWLFPQDGSGNDYAISDFSYDGRHPQSLAAHSSGIAVLPIRGWMANVEVLGLRSLAGTGVVGGSVRSFGPAGSKNVYVDGVHTGAPDRTSGINHMLVSGNNAYPPASVRGAPQHLMFANNDRSIGNLFICAARISDDGNDYMPFTGSPDFFYSGGAGALYTTGITEWTLECPFPVVGITSMAGIAYSKTVSNFGSATFEFRMASWGQEYPAGWTTYSAVNLIAAFDALTDYDSSVGFKIESRINSVVDYTGTDRYWQSIEIAGCTLDSGYVAPFVGFLEIAYNECQEGASACILDPSDIEYGYSAAISASGAYYFDEFPYNYDGLAVSCVAVVRKAGYSEARTAIDVYALGVTLPMQSALIEACTDADVGTIAQNGATATTTLSGDATFAQLYQDAQWWAHQSGNMKYVIPVLSGGNGAYTTYHDVVVTGYTLNGSGSLAMGGNTLTANDSFSYTYTGGTFSQATTVPTFAGGDLTLPTAGTYTFTMSSGEIVFDATSAAWDLSGSTIDSGVTLSNTSGAGITVAMPAGYPTTTIGSGATEIIVTAPAVERGLEFTGLLAGSFVRVVKNGDQSELFIDTNSATSETWDDATSGSLVVDYVIMKNGYDQIHVTGVTVTGAVGTGIQTVTVNQTPARWYQASSALTLNTNAFANATTKLFGLDTTSTLQNFASYLMEQWIVEGGTGGAFANKPFPLAANGPNSFSWRDGWVADLTTYPNTITNLSRDGMRYINASGNVTAVWCAILTSGAPTGEQVRYQQSDAGTTVNADNTGEMDQLVQIISDPNGDGSYADGYDRSGYLVLKVQAEGYDQAESNVVTLYGTLEDQLYVVGLAPTANGIAAGLPGGFTNTTLTIEQGTYTEDSKTFSVRIIDQVGGSSGTEIMQWLRYYFEQGGTFQGEDAFNWHDLVRVNGSSFKTANGTVYGTAATKGVLVYENDGTTIHPDFTLLTADDGTTYSPPVVADVAVTGMPNAAATRTNLQLFNSTALSASAWAANTVYATGAIVKRTTGLGTESTAGLYFRATTGGTSHLTTEPTWVIATPGTSTTTDNDITWTCYAILFYDADPAAASYAATYTDGNEFLTGETAGIRFAEMVGGTSFCRYDALAVAATSGFSFDVAEEADTSFATIGFNGASAEATYSPNYVDDRLVFDANIDFDGTEGYAYFCYLLTSSEGMWDFWGGVTALDQANFRIEVGVLDMYFDCSSGFVKQTDNSRWFRSDGTRPARDPVTALGGGIEINWRVPVNVTTVAGVSVITGDITNPATLQSIATAVGAEATANPFAANVKKVTDKTVLGNGIPPTYDSEGVMTDPGDPWYVV